MVTTRSSQEAKATSSSPAPSQDKSAGFKRKSPSKPEQKDTKKQKTLEETLNGAELANDEPKPETEHDDNKVEATDDMSKIEPQADNPNHELSENKHNEPSTGKSSEPEASHTNGGTAVEESSKREESTPANILEKGIIYFFFRGRVNIEDPSNVNDIARSYIVLRPLPHGAKLGDGPIGDAGNNRLLALPKKVLPMSHRDRFMTFVEKSRTSFKDLKDNFIASNDYETKTAGTRHTPAATPAGEGVYAITSTGRESHLAYILTIPSEIGKVQKDLGLHERGSFITSVKNPQYESPANASLPQGAEYPQEILNEFRSLRWMPLQAKHLEYVNTQILLIGEGQGDIGKAGEQQQEDTEQGKDKPVEEMEKLEEEDEERIKGLKGDESEAVFADLGLSAKDYPNMETTWN